MSCSTLNVSKMQLDGFKFMMNEVKKQVVTNVCREYNLDYGQVCKKVNYSDDLMVADLPCKKGINMCEDGSCPIEGCGYVCNSKKGSTFAMHISMKHRHNYMKTYMCKQCNKQFTSSSNLKTHQRQIHETWKFHCLEPGCGQKCGQKSALITHHISKHLKMKESDCVDENGCCLNCLEKVTSTGIKYHYAKCIGLEKTLNI